MIEREYETALKEFRMEGGKWKPTLNGSIPILALLEGETAVMFPGTIYASVTLTDVSVVGGMIMDERILLDHLKVWQFMSERNRKVTTGDHRKQIYAIINMLRKWAHCDPARFGMKKKDLTKLDRYCNQICGDVMSCSCEAECSDGCECDDLGVMCGLNCTRTLNK